VERLEGPGTSHQYNTHKQTQTYTSYPHFTGFANSDAPTTSAWSFSWMKELIVVIQSTTSAIVEQ
jgi:hypothetical protein